MKAHSCLLWLWLLVGCARPAPAAPAPAPCAPTVPIYDRESTLQQQFDSWQQEAEQIRSEVRGAVAVEQSLFLDPPDGMAQADLPCGDVIMQWIWSDRTQAGPKVIYPGGACDFCILSCASTMQAMWGTEGIEGDGGAFLEAIMTCVAAHCPEAQPVEKP